MNHSYTRAGGVWTSLTDLLAAEMADLDAKTVDSVSATGGTYALTSDMVIGGAPGADWQFDIPVTFTDDASFQGTFSIFGNPAQIVSGIDCFSYLNVSGLSHFYDDATFHDPVYYQALAQFLGNCEMFGNVYMGNTSGDLLLVSATADFEGPVSFNDPVDAYDTWTFHGTPAFQAGAAFNGGTVTFLSATTLGVPLQFTLDGRIPKRQAICGNESITYSPRLYDHVHMPAGIMSTNRTAKIDDTGAVDGDRMRFSTQHTTPNFYFSVLSPAGATLADLQLSSGVRNWCDVERIGGQWRACLGAPIP
jgi:hypothetical protein